MKTSFKKLLNDIRNLDWKSRTVKGAAALFLSFPLALGYLAYQYGTSSSNDIRNSSVMILNRKENSGGTGIILKSTKSQSFILTNSHVCQGLKKGGVVKTNAGEKHQVITYLDSGTSDLCIVTVAANLKINTKIADKAPLYYSQAVVSGHPALMPNVITSGHFSGRSIINVLVGFRACSDKELENPDTGMFCIFFGGLPVVKAFESILVTATIMPGSSGSGVYNDDMELSGVVFAGSGSIGYAWTVPYEQVINFIRDSKEFLNAGYATHAKAAPAEIDLGLGIEEEIKKVNTTEILRKCNMETKAELLNVCRLIERDMVWRNQ